MYNETEDVRGTLGDLLSTNQFVIDKSGSKVIEIINASFLATDPTLFGEVSESYVQRELEWYQSMSRSVYDIPGGPPAIWKQVADSSGMINSNYGWCIWSYENYSQYSSVRDELLANPFSRRAVMIYTRPSMQLDYNTNGMSDFMCTNAVQYVIRNNRLDAIVQMRSNDVWAGYRNDWAWQSYVLDLLCKDLNIKRGDIHWNAGSLHCYEKDFYLIDHYIKTGEITISKKLYREKYPDSKYC